MGTTWTGLRPTGAAAGTGPLPARPALARGGELGRFHFGSTVIVLFPRGRVRWLREVQPGRTVRMGQALGQLVDAAAGRPGGNAAAAQPG